MKKTILIAFAVVSALCSFAADGAAETVCKWTGGVSSEWNEAGNWKDSALPGSGDVAYFNIDASVSPPASFAGVLWVEGKVSVTATMAEAGSFALRLTSGSDGDPSFVKRGSAALKLRAWRGLNRGTGGN